MNKELLTIQQVAKILNVSTKTLRRWEKKGILIPQRSSGNYRLYTQDDIEILRNNKGKFYFDIAEETNEQKQSAPLGKQSDRVEACKSFS